MTHLFTPEHLMSTAEVRVDALFTRALQLFLLDVLRCAACNNCVTITCWYTFRTSGNAL